MRRIATSGLAYALGSVANSAALLLLLPFLVGVLSPEEYGTWALYEVSILILTAVAMLGLDVGMMRQYWQHESEVQRRRVLGTALGLQLNWSISLIGLIWIVSAWVRPQVCATEACGMITPIWLGQALLIVLLETAFNLLQAVLRIRERAATFAIMAFVRLILFLGLALLALWFGYGLTGALFGRLGASLIALIVLAVLVRSYLSIAFDRAMLGQLLRYGLPLLPTALAAYVLLAADRYMLQAFVSLEAVAIYTFAYKIASGLDVLIIRPYSLDWAPRRFALAARPDPGPAFAEALVVYLFLAGSGGLAIAAIAPFAFGLLAPVAYQPGLATLPIILLALVVFGASYPLNIGIMLNDRTALLPWLSWLAAGLCLGLNLWLIPRYGMIGAAWATLIAYGAYTLLIAWASLRIYPVPYQAGRLGFSLMALVVGSAGVAVSWWLGMATSLIGVLVGLVWVGMIMGLAAYWLWRPALIARAEPNHTG